MPATRHAAVFFIVRAQVVQVAPWFQRVELGGQSSLEPKPRPNGHFLFETYEKTVRDGTYTLVDRAKANTEDQTSHRNP